MEDRQVEDRRERERKELDIEKKGRWKDRTRANSSLSVCPDTREPSVL